MKNPIKLIHSSFFPVALLLSFALRSLSAAEIYSPYVTQQVDVLHGLVPESTELLDRQFYRLQP